MADETQSLQNETDPLLDSQNKKIIFCRLRDDYVAFLKSYDAKVLDNYRNKRPYLGIVLNVGNHRFLAPLTSNKNGEKDKLKTVTNGTIFHIKGGELGFIHLNNMIPLLDSAIINFRFEDEADKSYGKMLEEQFQFCDNNKAEIFDKAEKLYKKRQAGGKFFETICCDFGLLESIYTQFQA